MKLQVLWLCGVSLLGCATAARTEQSRAAAARGSVQAGPVAQSIPPGAVVARDGTHLSALLADAQGPSEMPNKVSSTRTLRMWMPRPLAWMPASSVV